MTLVDFMDLSAAFESGLYGCITQTVTHFLGTDVAVTSMSHRGRCEID